MFDEFNIFLRTKICPLVVLLEKAEQTLRPGMYDLIVLVKAFFLWSWSKSLKLSRSKNLSFDREISSWVSKVIQDCFSLYFVMWLVQKLVPLPQPIRFKTKTWLLAFFLRFGRFACFHFEFSLASCDISGYDWLLCLLWLWLWFLWHSIEKPSKCPFFISVWKLCQWRILLLGRYIRR